MLSPEVQAGGHVAEGILVVQPPEAVFGITLGASGPVQVTAPVNEYPQDAALKEAEDVTRPPNNPPPAITLP